MRYFIRVLLITLFINNAHSAKLINLETKDFGNRVAFVFHHQDFKNLQILSIGKKIIVKGDQALTLKHQNLKEFTKFASELTISSDKTTVSFKFLPKYSNYHKIDGEKLTAIEFVLQDEGDKSSKLEQASKENNIQISIKKKGGDILLQFPLTEKIGSAVFIKDNYLWIVLDKYKKFVFPAKNNILASAQQIQDNQKTILRFKLDGQKVSKFYQNTKEFVVELSKKSKLIAGKNIIITPFEDDQKVLLKLRSSQIYKLHDSNIGDDLYVLTVLDDQKINQKIDLDGYKIIETIRGAVIATLNDGLKVDQKEQGVFLSLNDRKFKNEIFVIDQGLEGANLLPLSLDAAQAKSFLSTKLALEAAIAKSSSNKEFYDNSINLANFYFLYEMYQESLSVLNVSSIEYPEFFSKDLKPYFLTAVDLILIDRNLKAQEILKNIALKLPDASSFKEFELWNNYNEFKLNKNKSSINLLDYFEIIDHYKDNLYFKVVFAGLESYLHKGEIDSTNELLKKVRQTKDLTVLNDLLFYKAKLYSLKNQNAVAKEIYKEILKNPANELNFVRATLALTQLRNNEQEITTDEAINVLNDIRLKWRGDSVEQDVLVQLAQYYKHKKDNINLLRTYKYIQDYCYKDGFFDVNIASESSLLAKQLFLTNDSINDLESVSLFLEFKRYIPSSEEGNQIVMKIAEKMLKLGLYDSFEELLLQHLSVVEKADKIEAADLLAKGYLADEKPQEAIKILESTDFLNSAFSEYAKRSRLKAEAYEMLGQTDKAIKYLEIDESKDAYPIKKRLYVKANQWQKFINLTEESTLSSIQYKIGQNSEINHDVMMLAIGYIALDKKAEFDSLIGYLALNPDLQASVKNLSSLANIDNTNLDMSDVQKFIDSYKKMF
jgi:hypothetical protein